MSKSILDLSAQEAFDYFMREDVYTTLTLPNYFRFSSFLRKIEAEYNSWSSKNPLNNSRDHYKESVLGSKPGPKRLESVNHIIALNKEGAYSFRRMTITNPILYFYLVKLITEESNWNIIIDRFKTFHSKAPFIRVSSILRVPDDTQENPQKNAPEDVPNENKNSTSNSISNPSGCAINKWWTDYELAAIQCSMKYEYMLKTDITNFYPSIYVHSLSWAISNRKICKDNLSKKDKDCPADINLGRSIEDYILSMQSGETMGIPIGSGIFDLLAELVLGYADMMLAEALQESTDSDLQILRYRDDYTIFSNDSEKLKKVISTLHSVLSDLKLSLNERKTEFSDSSSLNILKKDKIASLRLPTSGSLGILKEAYSILMFTSEHPNSGQLCRILIEFSKRLQLEKNKEHVEQHFPQLVSILCEIAIRNRKHAQFPIAIISQLLSRPAIPDQQYKSDLAQQLVDRFKKQVNIGYIEIWLQRALLATGTQEDFNEALCKYVENTNTKPLWNVSWVKQEYLDKIAWNSTEFIDREALCKITPFIEMDEISVFGYC